MKRILKLTLTHKWFYLIATGKKVVEYREFKQWSIARLLDKHCYNRVYDEVHFTNGYGPKAAFMRVEYKGLDIIGMATKLSDHRPENGEPLEKGSLIYRQA